MPTWGEILNGMLLHASKTNGEIPVDSMRREAVANLTRLTGRPTVVYMTRWTSGGASPEHTMVNIEDVHSLMEVLHGIRGPSLDLILHSSGGVPTAAEAIIHYIRTRFDDVRVIVPLAAMSAATMLACGADRIMMGKHSFLGPIDPQLPLQTPLGVQSVPAQAIREQFLLAQKEASNPANFAAWIPMLQQYGPALFVQCKHFIDLSELLVATWLEKWMFRADSDANTKATAAAKALTDHLTHKVHGRYLARNFIKNDLRLVVEDLEENQDVQDAVLTIFHTYMHTFSFAPAVQKIFENNIGKTVVRQSVGTIKPPQQIQWSVPAEPPPATPRKPSHAQQPSPSAPGSTLLDKLHRIAEIIKSDR